MPKLRRLSGAEVIKILEQFGFEAVRIKGSHHIMQRTVMFVDEAGKEQEEKQTLSVPVHGRKDIPVGTLQAIYRDANRFVEQEDWKAHFYAA